MMTVITGGQMSFIAFIKTFQGGSVEILLDPDIQL